MNEITGMLKGNIINADPKWLLNPYKQPKVDISKLNRNNLVSWIVVGPRTVSLQGEDKFCDAVALDELLQLSSEQMDNFTREDILDCRKRCNPYEAVAKAFFVNRAATKFANLDAMFKFSRPTSRLTKSNKHTKPVKHIKPTKSTKAFKDFKPTDLKPNIEADDDEEGILTFVDINGGPGGFVDYLLWRRGWEARGIGITLKDGAGTNYNFGRFASHYDSFDTYMGTERDGDIMKSKNVQSFCRYVKRYNANGVRLAVADGAVDYPMPSCLKELVSKQLLLVHFQIALSTLQTGGTFVAKLFNTFTSFTVGLIYLLYQCFEKITILKPAGSRPINSERYLVCISMKSDTIVVYKHLQEISKSMLKMKDSERDVIELVSHDVLTADKSFFNYMYASNNDISREQMAAMRKMQQYKDDKELVHPLQTANRLRCLQLWNLPEEIDQTPLQNCTKYLEEEYGSEQPLDANRERLVPANLSDTLGRLEDEWWFVSFSQHNGNVDPLCTWFVSQGGANVYMWSEGEWIPNDDTAVLLILPPKTLIFAELVTEYIRDKDANLILSTALHIIDGQLLGGFDLRGMTFAERHHQCQRFAKAINCVGTVYKNRAGKYCKKVEIRCKERRLIDGLMKAVLEWKAGLDDSGKVMSDVGRIEVPAKIYCLGGVLFIEDKAPIGEHLWWTWAGKADIALEAMKSSGGANSLTAFHFRKIFG